MPPIQQPRLSLGLQEKQPPATSPSSASTLGDILQAFARSAAEGGATAMQQQTPEAHAAEASVLGQFAARGATPVSPVPAPQQPTPTYSEELVRQSEQLFEHMGVPPSMSLSAQQGQRGVEAAEAFNPNPVSAGAKAISSFGIMANLRKLAESLKGKFQTAVVDAQGIPKVLYHGTPHDFPEFDISKSQPGLYGKGIYLTESSEVAGGSAVGGAGKFGYATPRQEPSHAIANKQLEAQQLNELFQQGRVGRFDYAAKKDSLMKEIQDLQRQRASSSNPNVRPVFVDIRKPFDMDASRDVRFILRVSESHKSFYPLRSEEAAKQVVDTALLMPTNSQVYDLFRRHGYPEEALRQAMKDTGYDGITHMGGAISGGKPHRVWIAFDPAQVKSVFDPDLQRMSGWRPQAQAR